MLPIVGVVAWFLGPLLISLAMGVGVFNAVTE